MKIAAAARASPAAAVIAAPDEVAFDEVADLPVLANVFNSSERSVVELSVDDSDAWVRMEHAPQPDPVYARVAGRQSEQRGGRSTQMWEGRLPEGLSPGGHLIRVRTVDMHGQVHHGSRIIRVVDR